MLKSLFLSLSEPISLFIYALAVEDYCSCICGIEDKQIHTYAKLNSCIANEHLEIAIVLIYILSSICVCACVFACGAYMCDS